MSNSEGDIDDELLALAGGSPDKKKKERRSSKKRKAEVTSDSEAPEPESEDEFMNPYPLEGKYVDDDDREKLLDMTEMERESIIATRLEEMQKLIDKRNLDAMLRENRGAGASARNGAGDGEDEDNVARAAKRQHTQRGATREKTRKLDELKARRRDRDDRKRTRTNSPRRSRSSSPMDMEMSDDESEDGQITKMDQEEERRRGVFGNGKDASQSSRLDDLANPVTVVDLRTCWLSRNKLLQHAMTPWFEDYIKGAYLRYMIGPDPLGAPKYRICEVMRIVKGDKPYKVQEIMTDDWLELKIGANAKVVKMDLVSNTPPDESDFEKWTAICLVEKAKLPSRSDLEKKHAIIDKWNKHSRTEADITAIINRKRELSGTQSAQSLTLERSRLTQARTLAQRRQDYDEVAELDKQLQKLEATVAAAAAASASTSTSTSALGSDGGGEAGKGGKAKNDLAAVNERNRIKNMEAIRRMEIAEAEKKNRLRKAAREAASGTATPVPRPGTPAEGAVKTEPGAKPMVPLKPVTTANSSFLATIDVDLGDF